MLGQHLGVGASSNKSSSLFKSCLLNRATRTFVAAPAQVAVVVDIVVAAVVDIVVAVVVPFVHP